MIADRPIHHETNVERFSTDQSESAKDLDAAAHQSKPILIPFAKVPGRLSIHRRTLEREIARERFPRPLKIGSKSMVRAEDINQYVRRLEIERDEKWERPKDNTP
jgi:predicted DNA-binding transcriptional regulator AlpA